MSYTYKWLTCNELKIPKWVEGSNETMFWFCCPINWGAITSSVSIPRNNHLSSIPRNHHFLISPFFFFFFIRLFPHLLLPPFHSSAATPSLLYSLTGLKYFPLFLAFLLVISFFSYDCSPERYLQRLMGSKQYFCGSKNLENVSSSE